MYLNDELPCDSLATLIQYECHKSVVITIKINLKIQFAIKFRQSINLTHLLHAALNPQTKLPAIPQKSVADHLTPNRFTRKPFNARTYTANALLFNRIRHIKSPLSTYRAPETRVNCSAQNIKILLLSKAIAMHNSSLSRRPPTAASSRRIDLRHIGAGTGKHTHSEMMAVSLLHNFYDNINYTVEMCKSVYNLYILCVHS